VLIALLGGQVVELLTLFGLALWHELGHFLMAKAFRWRIREILLLPFGGVLVVDEAASTPIYQEILVTLAGPCQHIWAILITVVLFKNGILSPLAATTFIEANVFMALFNLIPVNPLDGGKLFTAICSYWLRYYQLLRWSAAWSVTIGIIGLVTSIMVVRNGGLALNLATISTFVIYSNWQAWKHVPYQFRRFLLHRKSGNRPLSKIVVNREVGVEKVVRRFVRGKNHVIYIGNRVVTEARFLQLYWHVKSIATRHKL
jgi:stage IV sporulation protein FB